MHEEKISSFSIRLRELMDAKGLNNTDIAKVTGKHISNISRYLNGQYAAKQDVIYAIAQEYGVSEAWLMGYDVPMISEAPSTNEDYDIRVIARGAKNMSPADREILLKYMQFTFPEAFDEEA